MGLGADSATRSRSVRCAVANQRTRGAKVRPPRTALSILVQPFFAGITIARGSSAPRSSAERLWWALIGPQREQPLSPQVPNCDVQGRDPERPVNVDSRRHLERLNPGHRRLGSTVRGANNIGVTDLFTYRHAIASRSPPNR